MRLPTSSPNGRRNLLIGVVVAGAAVGAGWAAHRWLKTPPAVPSFQYTTLEGQARNSGDLRGRVVLVNFWATSCGTCVAEMPELVATHKKFASQGFETVAVAMHYDPPAYVANFAQSRQLPFTVAIDNTGSIAKAFQDVQLTPTTYLLNKNGEIVKRFVGAPNFAKLHVLIEQLLQESR